MSTHSGQLDPLIGFFLAAAIGAGGLLLATVGPVPVLGLFALVFFAGLAVYFPMFLVAGYIVLMVTNAAAVATEYHGAPSIGGVFVPGLLAILLLRRAARLEDLRASVYLIVPIGLYFSVNALGLLWVDNLPPTVERLSELLKNLAILFVLCGFITTRSRLRVACYAAGGAAAALAALSVLQYATGTFTFDYFGFATATVKNIFGEIDNWRLQGPIDDPNYFAQLLVLSLPLVTAIAFVAREPLLRLGGLVGVPLILVTIIFTFSRGALVSVVGIAAATVLLSRHRVSIALGVLIAAVILILAVPDLFLSRLVPILDAMDSVIRGTQAIQDPALAQRVSVMRGGLVMFEANPILGVGLGQFQYVYSDYALVAGLDLGVPPQAHNRYIELAAEQGILGLFAFCVVIGTMLSLGFVATRRFRRLGYTVEGALVTGLLLGMFGYLMTAIFLHDDYTRVFWLFASLIVSAFAISLRADPDGP